MALRLQAQALKPLCVGRGAYSLKGAEAVCLGSAFLISHPENRTNYTSGASSPKVFETVGW